jgi:glycerophosphoryl diester phosphodiesterase
LTPGRLAIGLLLAAGAAVLSAAWLFEDIRTDDAVVIVAHRGAAGRAPENTTASVQAALDDRADWVEVDVQETVDGEVVVVHDSDFMKLAGDATKVWEATLEQLADIDIGSWFGPEFAAERVPTLRDVLQLAEGRAGVVIELKYYGHDEKLEQRVADIVEQTGMTDSVAIMSLKYGAVQKMKAIRPDWTVGLLSATAIGDLSRMDADFLAVSTNMVSAGFVRRARKAGKKVFAWTVNDPVTMSQVISKGVDGVITDEPAMARRVLAERAEMNTAERLLIYAAMLFGEDFAPREYRDDSP